MHAAPTHRGCVRKQSKCLVARLTLLCTSTTTKLSPDKTEVRDRCALTVLASLYSDTLLLLSSSSAAPREAYDSSSCKKELDLGQVSC